MGSVVKCCIPVSWLWETMTESIHTSKNQEPSNKRVNAKIHLKLISCLHDGRFDTSPLDAVPIRGSSWWGNREDHENSPAAMAYTMAGVYVPWNRQMEAQAGAKKRNKSEAIKSRESKCWIYDHVEPPCCCHSCFSDAKCKRNGPQRHWPLKRTRGAVKPSHRAQRLSNSGPSTLCYRLEFSLMDRLNLLVNWLHQFSLIALWAK